jgi:hypothetical protein
MTNNQTKGILKTCLSELRKIQDDPNHLNVDQAQDLFGAIESLESLLRDFDPISNHDIAMADLIINACKQ